MIVFATVRSVAFYLFYIIIINSSMIHLCQKILKLFNSIGIRQRIYRVPLTISSNH